MKSFAGIIIIAFFGLAILLLFDSCNKESERSRQMWEDLHKNAP